MDLCLRPGPSISAQHAANRCAGRRIRRRIQQSLVERLFLFLAVLDGRSVDHGGIGQVAVSAPETSRLVLGDLAHECGADLAGGGSSAIQRELDLFVRLVIGRFPATHATNSRRIPARSVPAISVT